MKLFVKKNVPESPRRRASIPDASVRRNFSYYTSRSSSPTIPADDTIGRQRPGDQKKPPSSSWRQRKWGFFVGIMLGLFLVGQMTLVGTSAVVKVVQADGSTIPSENDQYQKTLNSLLGASIFYRNKLTIDTAGITRDFQKTHPEVEAASLTLPFFGSKPVMYVSVSGPAFVLESAAMRYSLSASGYVTGEADETSELPRVIDETGASITISKQLLPASQVKFMQTVFYQLDNQNLALDSFVLPKTSAYEVDVRLKGKPFLIRLNFAEDAMQQSGAVVATLKQLGDKVPSSYLDVRVPGRVYYK